MQQLNQKFRDLEAAVNAEVLERRQEIHTAVLALLCRKHHFQVGPPGEAKSLLVDRITRRIGGLGDEGYFRYLLTQYTQPDELFGGPNFLLLKDSGIYKRVTTRKLPKARIAFLDEIFRGNSSILNTLLTVMNERLFDNGDDDPRIDLDTMFGAANSLPDEADLNAMWDRLHFRHVVSPLHESSNFIQMLDSRFEKDPDAVIDLEDLRAAQTLIDEVVIPESVYEALRGLREDLKKDGVEPTSRRWVDCSAIIKAEAWYNGRDVADTEDVRPLMHVLWDADEQRKVVRQQVLQLANPLDREVSDMLDAIHELETEYDRIVRKNIDNDKDYVGAVADIFSKVQRLVKGDNKDKGMLKVQKEIEESGRESYLIDELKARVNVLGTTLQTEIKGRTNI